MTRSHRLLLPTVLSLVVGALLVAPSGAAAAAVQPTATSPAPATPLDVRSIVGNSSVLLSWEQPSTGPRPDHFRVYEGDTVVARNTTTHATVKGLPFMSSHTFRVTAVAADGSESPASAPITRSIYIPGVDPACLPVPPAEVVVSDVSSSAASLTWARSDPQRSYRIVGAGQEIATSIPQVRVGGLAPEQTYTFSVYGTNCWGPVLVGSVTVATPAGPSRRPGSPANVEAVARTDSSAVVTWSAPVDGPRVTKYAVYHGATLVRTTRALSVRLRGLWRGTRLPVTVAALGVGGAESVHSAPVVVQPATCDPTPPAPEQLSAAAVSASSVELHWLTRAEATSFTVLDGAVAVATVQVPSARITGLASGSRHRFRVVSNLADGCGASPASRRVTVTTSAGPSERLGAPTGLRGLSTSFPFGTVALQWQAPVGAVPAEYRIYEGATLFGTTTDTGFTTVVSAATTHRVSVVAVDAAGNESALSDPTDVTGFFLPVP